MSAIGNLYKDNVHRNNNDIRGRDNVHRNNYDTHGRDHVHRNNNDIPGRDNVHRNNYDTHGRDNVNKIIHQSIELKRHCTPVSTEKMPFKIFKCLRKLVN